MRCSSCGAPIIKITHSGKTWHECMICGKRDGVLERIVTILFIFAVSTFCGLSLSFTALWILMVKH